MSNEHPPPSSTPCPRCGVINVLDSRAAKTNCVHFCFTCASTERRLPLSCKSHPERK